MAIGPKLVEDLAHHRPQLEVVAADDGPVDVEENVHNQGGGREAYHVSQQGQSPLVVGRNGGWRGPHGGRSRFTGTSSTGERAGSLAGTVGRADRAGDRR